MEQEKKQKQIEQKLETTQNQITEIKDVIINREEDWRKEVARKLRKIGLKYDGMVITKNTLMKVMRY